jgi:Zn-finger nucleic acid-binding protein
VLICSTCNIPLCRIEYEGVTVHVCPDCEGTLVGAEQFEAIERRRERTWTDDGKRQVEIGVHEAPVRDACRCPRCLLEMERIGMQIGDSGFRLDVCKDCRLYWFDRGELEFAQILFEQEQDGRTEDDLHKIERQAAASMQLQEEAAEIAEGHRAEEEGAIVSQRAHAMALSNRYSYLAHLAARVLGSLLTHGGT